MPFIDLNDIIAERYEAVGQHATEAYFADRHTHTTRDGAQVNAESVVAGLHALKIDALDGWLTLTAKNLPPAKETQVSFPDQRPVLDNSAADEKSEIRVSVPTLYIIGDSTVRNGHLNGVGWGEVIDQYFDPSKLNVANRAIGGRSARSYMRENRWKKVFDRLKSGDLVLMQFGHNDGGLVGDPRFKRRPALPGVGQATRELTFGDDSNETVHTYGWYLRQFCEDARKQGAIAIICSPVPHKNNWHEGRFKPDFGDHRIWCRQVADAANAHYIDLTGLVGKRYQTLGEAKVDTLFADARTHTNLAGAVVNSDCVLEGLRSLEEIRIERYLSDYRHGAPSNFAPHSASHAESE